MAGEFADIKELWRRFEEFQHIYLATIEGDQPKVRPVTLIHFDERFWVTTDTWSAKVKQIQKNPNVEFSFVFKEGHKDCCIRVAGLAKIIKDKETKERIAGHCDFFSEHWESVDDPGYTLLEICPAEIGYVRPDKIIHMKV